MVRQPKKLTDCPENLRESIDWLIQVKHGNGNGDGLGPLAEALKKFINDAIKKAEKSLTERQKQLECPSKSSEESYCDELQEKIKKAQNPKNESELSKLKSEKDKHYNEVHYLTQDARDKALKDIKERQTKLSELKDKLEAFIGKDKDNAETCQNLLTNLSEGLEKFLGFNSESKGYDGSGIVYSDLDRLCDGVMAFLHGVLSGVKG
ncbi:hypothetical protein, conserved [Babesia ovata]|uniref:Uncharacterized protein n=1 Tax=Babesia ovata TaxID=189622 RepID=A0A2H6KAR8_9APIC|nr:uncharacterized protein BOVATA_015870 [Babesia ovata]GBE60094.1 hypothetical protein, conserved [Babesia ovata]